MVRSPSRCSEQSVIWEETEPRPLNTDLDTEHVTSGPGGQTDDLDLGRANVSDDEEESST